MDGDGITINSNEDNKINIEKEENINKDIKIDDIIGNMIGNKRKIVLLNDIEKKGE
ncbi:MAG: hypothetical protein ACOCP8_01385 [archaeon]